MGVEIITAFKSCSCTKRNPILAETTVLIDYPIQYSRLSLGHSQTLGEVGEAIGWGRGWVGWSLGKKDVEEQEDGELGEGREYSFTFITLEGFNQAWQASLSATGQAPTVAVWVMASTEACSNLLCGVWARLVCRSYWKPFVGFSVTIHCEPGERVLAAQLNEPTGLTRGGTFRLSSPTSASVCPHLNHL